MDFKQIHDALVLLRQETKKLHDIIQQNVLDIFKRDYIYERKIKIISNKKKIWINVQVAVDTDKYGAEDFLKHSCGFINSLRDLFSDIEYSFNECDIDSSYGRLKISLEIYMPDYSKV